MLCLYSLQIYTMNIEGYFLFCLIFIMTIGLWRVLFPVQEFLQMNCIYGEITLSEGKKKSVECASCQTFPIHQYQRGSFKVMNGNYEQLKRKGMKLNSQQLVAIFYMQKDCIQYECQDLINHFSFTGDDFLSMVGLTEMDRKRKLVNDDVWDVEFSYDNYVAYPGLENYKINLINSIIGPLIPYSLVHNSPLYNGMALKLRYTQPLDKQQESIKKPVVKISLTNERIEHYIMVSLIVTFAITVKLRVLNPPSYYDFFHFLLSFTFIGPYMFSFLILLVYTFKTSTHGFSLLVFTISLSLQSNSGLFLSFLICSIIQGKMMNTEKKIQILVLNLIVLLSILLGFESIYSQGPLLLYIIELKNEQINKYEAVKLKISNQMVENDQIEFHIDNS